MFCWSDFSSVASSVELEDNVKVTEPLLSVPFSTSAERPVHGGHEEEEKTSRSVPSDCEDPSQSDTDDYELGYVDYLQHQSGRPIISDNAAADFDERAQLHVDLMEAGAKRKPSQRLGRKKQKHDVRRERLLAYENIAKEIKGVFCTKTCTTCVDSDEWKNIEFVYDLRETYFTHKKQIARKEHMMATLTPCYDRTSNSFSFTLRGKQVCPKAWFTAHGFPKQIFYDLMKRVKQKKTNAKDIQPSTICRVSSAPVSTVIVGWLEVFAKLYGQKLPHKKQFRLPFQTKKQVYEAYVAEMERSNSTIANKHTFYYVWRTSVPHIKRCRKKDNFGICNFCSAQGDKLSKTRDVEEAKSIKREWNAHLLIQRWNQRKYYKHQMKGRTQSEYYTSLIIDGMEKKKTAGPMPAGKRFPYNVASEYQVEQQLVGVKVHGHGNFAFLHRHQIGTTGGANSTINVLLRTLQKLGPENLGKVLYLQLDNCSGDNKNRFVLMFCAYLVHIGLFDKVKISFLCVGHTHEDIDQLFSTYASYLRRYGALGLRSLFTALRNAVGDDAQKPLCELLNIRFDFKALVNRKEVMNIKSGIKGARVFRFQKYKRVLKVNAERQMNRDIEAAYTNATPTTPAIVPSVEPIIPGDEELREQRFRNQPAVDDEDEDSFEEYLDSSDDEEEEKVDAASLDKRHKLTRVLEQLYEETEKALFDEDEDENESANDSDFDNEVTRNKNANFERLPEDVVMHYKAMMCSTRYLPTHPEGVKVFLSTPDDEPEIEDLKEWDAMEATEQSIDKFLRVKSLPFTEEDREDWAKWKELITKPKEFFSDELKWNLKEIANEKKRLFDERQAKVFSDLRSWEDVLNAEQQNNDANEEFVASAKGGFSEAQKSRQKRRRVEEKRIAQEEEEAKNWEDIKAGDFVVVLEDPSTMTQEQRQTTYKGFHERELLCPLFVADAVEACASKHRDASVMVRRWRCTAGDFNKGFFKAVRINDNQDWVEEVPRSSIVQVGIEWIANGKKLSFKTKKQLVENSSTPCVFAKNARGQQILKFAV